MQKILVASILILGIALCVILVLIGISPSVENAAGLAHPDIPGMRVGGDGQARVESISTLAFLFQVFVLIQFACFIALGVTEKKRTAKFFLMIFACFLATLFVWWKIYTGHQTYLDEGVTQYVLGFPTSTAWVVYNIWLSGLSFVIVYVLGFKHYIWSDQDEADFNTLLQANNNQDNS